ncbi:TIGR04283 family arsenosugar biosynthesis glycosyltransferase [Coleofasciculus sp. FACHB-64]|uniref:TIGR04283 family arsenosugar biosynthesis glycosyltransferase n=1 Tax=Cyanophyceae TaxID=3028117 RepID=UPI0016827282|nr:TIGR04283 family arsenosugar biosynthesis glycosyltransferase [Coleofasciculus sp. FACHB-501]MBD2048718.1 TIGR04283 family arsenosugar biosynthesis glycosyltransferase [Coleofasciculus sp. FACHB-64]
MEAARISIIIPVLNEAANTIRSTLASVQNVKNVEVIVVDGGSQNETVVLVQSWGVKVLSSAAGRACQMNAGATAATGDILLFLHADTSLPLGFEKLVPLTLAQSGTVAGAFELKINSPMRSLRLVEKMVNWRSRFFSLPYGDQAIFLKASVFHDIGGFPNLPIMEDFEFICRLKRLGRISIAPAPVMTSARRWQKLGVLKTTLINQIVILGYFLGVPPSQLVKFYRPKK